MDSIPDDLLIINAADPDALTRLLDLPDLLVTRLERADWLGRLYLHCTVTTTQATCPTCHLDSESVHQYYLRTPRDLPWAGWACYLQITARRFWCSYCGCPFTETLAAVADAARTTRRFAAHLVECVRTSNVAATARIEQHGYKAVEGIFYRAAAAAHPEGPPVGLVRRLGIDEIATRKGHGHFQVVLCDLDSGQVLAQLADRRQETLREYLASWSAEQRAGVEEVATDFWAAYHTVAGEVFPQARVVGDRFHVAQHLTEAVTETRRTVQAQLGADDAEFVRTWKDVLVRNEEDLPAAEWVALAAIKTVVPELERVHTLKEEFRAIFEAPLEREVAAERVEEWLGRAWDSGLAALEKFADFVDRWRESILNYFVRRTSSGRVEGLNNKIKLLMRQAFGFANNEHFRLRVMMACDGRD
jgi:transposase